MRKVDFYGKHKGTKGMSGDDLMAGRAHDYRLPKGTIVRIPDTICHGDNQIRYVLKSGEVVVLTKMALPFKTQKIFCESCAIERPASGSVRIRPHGELSEYDLCAKCKAPMKKPPKKAKK